jgi:hypothetical protein
MLLRAVRLGSRFRKAEQLTATAEILSRPMQSGTARSEITLRHAEKNAATYENFPVPVQPGTAHSRRTHVRRDRQAVSLRFDGACRLKQPGSVDRRAGLVRE